MDETYVCPKLKKLCSVMYIGEPFAKYNKRRNKYVFGSIDGARLYKNTVEPGIAYFLIGGIKILEGK